MLYERTGFRFLYREFCAFPVTPSLKAYLLMFPRIEKARYVLTWGWIDAEKGLMLEILAVGDRTEKGWRFFPNEETRRYAVPVKMLENEEFECLYKNEKQYARKYARKLELLKHIDPEVPARRIRELDHLRDRYLIDVLTVTSVKEDGETEQCQARIREVILPFFTAVLPGSEKEVLLRYEKGQLVSGMPSAGTDLPLKEHLSRMRTSHTDRELLEFLRVLNSSTLLVPCRDTEKVIPEMMEMSDHRAFAVFADRESMEPYWSVFPTVERTLKEVLEMIRDNDENITEIIVDPYCESVSVDRSLAEILIGKDML